MRIRVDLGYRGTDFSGWARQPGLRTVQATVEDALSKVIRQPEPVKVVVAGRTDAGVHARGQVIHADVELAAWQRVPGRSTYTPADALIRRLTGVLPDDVVAYRAREVTEDFDARFSPLSRTYRYRICDDLERRDPLRADHVVFHRHRLSEKTMDTASRALTGLQDFAAYCKPREGATTIRTLIDFTWERPASGADEGLVVATVTADAFCHSMVRALVGSAMMVGEGRRGPAWMLDVLTAKDRAQAGKVAAAHGLTLEAVTYPPDEALAARAELTRARRPTV